MTARFCVGMAVAITFLAARPGASAEPAGTPNVDVPVGHITGIGGIFFRSPNPKALAAWYRDVLGLKIENWGGAALSYDAPHHPRVAVWSPFPQKTGYIAP